MWFECLTTGPQNGYSMDGLHLVEAARALTHPTGTKSGVYYKLHAGGIIPTILEPLAKPREAWSTLSKSAIKKAEGDRVNRS